MTDFWTDDRCNELKRLYDDGLTCSQIAGRMGATSRNAIIGKLHRLGISGTRAVAKPKGPTLDRKPTSQGVGAAVQKINAAKVAPRTPRIKPEPFVPACVEIKPLNLAFADLQENDCRFGYGDSPILFCGHPKAAGSSYCGPHHRLCFAGVPQRRGGPHTAELGKARGGLFRRSA